MPGFTWELLTTVDTERTDSREGSNCVTLFTRQISNTIGRHGNCQKRKSPGGACALPGLVCEGLSPSWLGQFTAT